MCRIALAVALALGLLAPVAQSQQAGKVYRIGYLGSTSASTTVAMKLANDGCTQTPRPTRAGSGWPQPDFSATRLRAASRRGRTA